MPTIEAMRTVRVGEIEISQCSPGQQQHENQNPVNLGFIYRARAYPSTSQRRTWVEKTSVHAPFPMLPNTLAVSVSLLYVRDWITQRPSSVIISAVSVPVFRVMHTVNGTVNGCGNACALACKQSVNCLCSTITQTFFKNKAPCIKVGFVGCEGGERPHPHNHKE
jgi:hypothetical protein